MMFVVRGLVFGLIAIVFVLLITTSTEVAFAQSDTIRVIPDSTNYDTSKFPQPEIGKDLFFIESESVHVVEAGVIDPKIPIIDITVNGFNPFLYPNRSDAPTPQNYLIVTINRDYMDSKLSNGQDDQFIVLLDGTEIYHEEVNRFPPDRTLKFKIPLGYGQHLEIVGTEFSKNYVSNSFQENENILPVQNESGTYSNPTVIEKTIENKVETIQFEQENTKSVKNQFCFLFWCWDVEPKQVSKDNSFSSTIEEVVDVITPKPYNLYTYSINPIPDVPNKSIPLDAVKKALSMWEENNPDIEFIETNDSPHIVINWKVYEAESHQGVANCIFYENNDVRDCELDISLGQNDCNGKYVQQDVNNVSNTIMHEMGHSFGLKHSNDENHLMYGEDGIYQMDNLGYNIPHTLEEYYVGQKTIENKYDLLESKMDSLELKISQLQSEYDLIDTQYSKYVGKELPPNEYQTATHLYDKLNKISSQQTELNLDRNELVYQFNDIVELSNCFPNIK